MLSDILFGADKLLYFWGLLGSPGVSWGLLGVSWGLLGLEANVSCNQGFYIWKPTQNLPTFNPNQDPKSSQVMGNHWKSLHIILLTG